MTTATATIDAASFLEILHPNGENDTVNLIMHLRFLYHQTEDMKCMIKEHFEKHEHFAAFQHLVEEAPRSRITLTKEFSCADTANLRRAINAFADQAEVREDALSDLYSFAKSDTIKDLLSDLKTYLYCSYN